MKYFKLTLIFFSTFFLISGITNLNPKIDENYINLTTFIAWNWVNDTLITQKAWYNFILTDFSLVTDCKNNTCNYIDLDIDDETNSWFITKYHFSAYTVDETKNIINAPLKITGLLHIDNSINDFGIYVNISWFYLEEKDSIFTQLNKDILNKSFNDFISLLVLYLVHIYLFYFFAKSGFKLWKEYFFKKRKNEND